jgi:putative toxin-antitoxin system antitoxin component (TIGR02293 family)
MRILCAQLAQEVYMRAERLVNEVIREEAATSRSLHLRLGELLGLSSAVFSEADLIDRLQQGLPAGVAQALRTRAGLSNEEIYHLIAPRRTLTRREAERQSLSSDEADRAVRVARIVAHAQQVFSAKPAYALEWLRTAVGSLGDRSPLQVLTSDTGARAVEELLIGIEYGQFG